MLHYQHREGIKSETTYSHEFVTPSMPMRGSAACVFTSGVNNPPLDPFDNGLIWRRDGIPGISETELRGMGLGDEGWREECEAGRVDGGLGNSFSTGGGAPVGLRRDHCLRYEPISHNPTNASHNQGSSTNAREYASAAC